MGLLHLTVLGILFMTAAAKKKECFHKMEDKFGIIKSPRYPFWKYPVNTECHYLIVAPSGHHIELSFTHFVLEEKNKGNLTDYLEVFDGRKKNRKQEEYYYGRKEPFKFTSITTKVIMRFVSDGQIALSGFFAKYRVVPNPTCDPDSLQVIHGSKDCDVIAETGKTKGCDVKCDVNYQLHGPKSPKCMEFKNPPICSPIPETAERCAENITSCPYKMEEVVQYLLKDEEDEQEEFNITGKELEVMMEELDANITSRLSPGRGSGITYLSQCNPPICNSGKAYGRRYLIRCRYFYHRYSKMSLEEKRNRMFHCFKCQRVNCMYPVISQVFG